MLLAAADQQLHLSVPIVLDAVVAAMVWRKRLAWWQAAICVAAGIATADSSLGGPARSLMATIFGWVGGLHF
ncbi:hypothetical protein ACI1MP_38070 (plasmid) [Kitasatospora griseola]|uniref:hypothetical protein n=1 Tax=Kitasatospora griseola TaxID=2064 RepID=UPI0038558460